MTEITTSQTASVPEGTVQSGILRESREAAGLEVATLAAILKVPEDRLRALEEGRYQDLPNLTFARALASSVCRVLRIDPAPVLQSLPQVASVRLENGSTVKAVMPVQRRHSFLGWLNPRSPVAWTVMLLLLALVLWWWLPQRDIGDYLQPPTEPQLPAQGVVVESVATVAPQPAATVPQPASTEGVMSADKESPPAAAQNAPAASPAPPPVTATPSAVAESAAAKSASSQPLLQLRASETTWVQLKNAAGKELQQRTLKPGQTLDYDGQGPVQVVLGRASGVEVIVHGQPFDISTYASNRVARFEVK